MVSPLSRLLAKNGRHGRRSSPTDGSTRRCGPARPRRFSHLDHAVGHPYVLMNYQGKPRDVMTLAPNSVMAASGAGARTARDGADAVTLAETASCSARC